MTALFDQLTAQLDGSPALCGPLLRDERDFLPDALLRPAAVLIAVTDRADEPGVLLTHRPSTMASHPGQAALPGGKIEPGETAVEAALREAEEELGINPAQVRIIGALDDYKTSSGFHITPVLAVVPADITITPDPREVDSWFEPPLAFLLEPANRTLHQALWQGHMREYYEIMWQGHRVWGVTAGIIANLAHRLGAGVANV